MQGRVFQAEGTEGAKVPDVGSSSMCWDEKRKKNRSQQTGHGGERGNAESTENRVASRASSCKAHRQVPV